MEELELLKKDWNKGAGEFKEYSENEIFNMIKNKSVSITKTLLIIGLIEILLWTVYGYIDYRFPYIRMGLFVVFTILAVLLFRAMKSGQNSTTLMKNILNLRRIILGYAFLSVLFALIDSIIRFDHDTRDFMAGAKNGWNAGHHIEGPPSNPETMVPEMGNYVIFGVVTLIGFYLLYVVYKRTYGKILVDLRNNYKELSKQEENGFK